MRRATASSMDGYTAMLEDRYGQDAEQHHCQRDWNEWEHMPQDQDSRQAGQPDHERRQVRAAEVGDEMTDLAEEVALALGDPNSFGSWPAMIVRARPR